MTSWKHMVVAGAFVAVAATTSACSSTAGPAGAPLATSASTPATLQVKAGPPPPPGATGPPSVGLRKLAPVTVGASAPFGDVGLAAKVVSIDPVQLTAAGPGDIAGPGVSVKVELANTGTAPVDLTGVVVNSSYNNGTPASGTDSKPTAPVAGKLAAGQTAQGTYAFQVPSGEVGSVVVEVDYSGSANIVLIRS